MDLGKDIADEVMTYEGFDDVKSVIDHIYLHANVIGFIVGRKLAYAASNVIHEKGITSDCNWTVCLKKPLPFTYLFPKGVVAVDPIEPYESTVRLKTRLGKSVWIDFIVADGSLEYYDRATLNVDKMMLWDNLSRWEVAGPGIKAVESQQVEVNNPEPIPNGWKNIHNYTLNAATIMGLYYTPPKEAGTYKTPCDCFAGDIVALWREGCQSPDRHC